MAPTLPSRCSSPFEKWECGFPSTISELTIRVSARLQRGVCVLTLGDVHERADDFDFRAVGDAKQPQPVVHPNIVPRLMTQPIHTIERTSQNGFGIVIDPDTRQILRMNKLVPAIWLIGQPLLRVTKQELYVLTQVTRAEPALLGGITNHAHPHAGSDR